MTGITTRGPLFSRDPLSSERWGKNGGGKISGALDKTHPNRQSLGTIMGEGEQSRLP